MCYKLVNVHAWLINNSNSNKQISIAPYGNGNFREILHWAGGIFKFRNGNFRWPWKKGIDGILAVTSTNSDNFS